MKQTLGLMSMLAAVGLSTLAASSAMAGTDIVKCVDAGGHVTLTDQPCDTGTATVRLEALQDRTAPVAQRHVLPALPHQGAWKRPDLSRPAPLTRDVATLREARRTLMLEDAKPTLAGLQ